MKIVVYTAITGGFDDTLLTPGVGTQALHGIKFVCYSATVGFTPRPWSVVQPAWKHPHNARRTARYHKLHPHKLFPDADVSVWLDGSEQLLASPRKLIEKYLRGSDFATLRHPLRNTVKQEARACNRLKKDDAATLASQLGRYDKDKFPDKSGLFETCIVIRRHTPKIAELNEFWWSEIVRGSLRDQVSLPYALYKTGVNPNIITGQRGQCPYLRHRTHLSR